MEKNKSTMALTESGICTALTVIFGVMSIYVPVLNIVAILLLAVPAVIAGYRNGTAYSAMIMVASAILIMIFSTPLSALCLFLMYAPTAIVTTYMLRSKRSYLATFVIGTAVTVIGFGLMLACTEIVSGVQLASELEDLFNSSYEITLGAYQKMIDAGAITAEQLEEFKEYYKSTVDLVSMLVPAAIVMVSFILETAAVIISVFVLRRQGSSITPPKNFKYFTLPRSAALGGALMFLLAFLIGKTGLIDSTLILMNIQSILTFLFSIQGAAAAIFWLDSKNVKKGFMVIPMIILIVTTFGRLLLFYIGIFDICFNARKIFRGNMYEKK